MVFGQGHNLNPKPQKETTWEPWGSSKREAFLKGQGHQVHHRGLKIVGPLLFVDYTTAPNIEG